MFRILVLIIGLSIPSLANGEDFSPEMQKCFATLDRWQNAEATTCFLLVAYTPDKVGATENDVVEANYRLYELSLIMRLGHKVAIQHLEYAAKSGHPAAQNHLSYLITTTYGSKPNKAINEALGSRYSLRDAHNLLKAASDAGYYPAMIKLAADYRNGTGGALKDPVYAQELELKGVELALGAANAGDAEAAEDLSRYAIRGIGMPESMEQMKFYEDMAYRIYEARAESGSIKTKRFLAIRYSGIRPPENDQERARAEYWALSYLSAAQDYDAATMVAGLYGEEKFGSGPGPKTIAHILYNYASTLDDGDFAARQRDEIAAELTKSQTDTALRVARLCVDDGIPACIQQLPR
ncbi:hypothetical protein [Defluviimonas salinarum]|uniref:Sel1 repeat family protein n=1 Tax=Defluviimonas salinarum TaxID=2992147 RepID=A0ABT3J8A4_9RHOB|nr:hypothetical protein [Defluviimonas salinarum]MCW3783896.1 hypothetical protein [Defluviimonas salinarum]